MLTPEEIAERITAATAARRAIDPFTDTDPDLTLPTAYAAQDLVVAERVDGGHPVIGAKLGLTSRAKQRAMGVDEPLHGWLTADMVCAPGEPLDLGRWIHPRVEPEIAFVLGRELPGPASIADVLAASAGVCAVLEVIDSRYADFRFRLPDVVADNASGAATSSARCCRRPARSATCDCSAASFAATVTSSPPPRVRR
ncbi:hypothetical protein LUX57_26190 [Actinomadura madurae]|uniref:2-keto-4-pentenoate hydratase n=1 Tax=Actinomadura madurae TaxID=1993 RepID=UPI0020D239FC|nr:hypothetical protein [Actinomadura madurae]MCP9968218.1 hypothetical protein [Actinomadura madurae]